MTTEEMQSLAKGVALLALAFGFFGGMCFRFFEGVLDILLNYLERRQDKALRIRDARWRAHWNSALTEARKSGYQGRRAIAYAANTMRTRKAAIDELALH